MSAPRDRASRAHAEAASRARTNVNMPGHEGLQAYQYASMSQAWPPILSSVPPPMQQSPRMTDSRSEAYANRAPNDVRRDGTMDQHAAAGSHTRATSQSVTSTTYATPQRHEQEVLQSDRYLQALRRGEISMHTSDEEEPVQLSFGAYPGEDVRIQDLRTAASSLLQQGYTRNAAFEFLVRTFATRAHDRDVVIRQLQMIFGIGSGPLRLDITDGGGDLDDMPGQRFMQTVATPANTTSTRPAQTGLSATERQSSRTLAARKGQDGKTPEEQQSPAPALATQLPSNTSPDSQRPHGEDGSSSFVIRLRPQSATQADRAIKGADMTSKASHSTAKLLQGGVLNHTQSSRSPEIATAIRPAERLRVVSSNRVDMHAFCEERRNLAFLQSVPLRSRGAGRDDADTSDDDDDSSGQHSTGRRSGRDRDRRRRRQGDDDADRKDKKSMVVGYDSDALEIGVYIEARSSQADVMKLTAAPRLLERTDCISDFNQIGNLLNAKYGSAGSDDVFDRYDVELHVTVSCTMTDANRALARNNILGSCFRNNVSIVARVEALAAPRLHWAFQNNLIHKGDTVLVLSCTASSNDIAAYDISNPRFSYREHSPPHDIPGGWPKVEQEFREWLSLVFGSNFDTIDPLLVKTHSEFIKDFRSLYFQEDIRQNPKYVHCLHLDMPHDGINRGYYDTTNNCVLVSSKCLRQFIDVAIADLEKELARIVFEHNNSGEDIKLVCAGDFLDVPYVKAKVEAFLLTLPVETIQTPPISSAPAAIIREQADLHPKSRKAQRNYGWIVSSPFRDNDPTEYKFWEAYAGQWYCRDRVLWQIHKGQDINGDSKVSTNLTIVASGDKPATNFVQLVSHAHERPDYAFSEDVERHARIVITSTKDQIMKKFQRRNAVYGLGVTAEIALGHDCGVLVALVRELDGAEVLGGVTLDFSEVDKA